MSSSTSIEKKKLFFIVFIFFTLSSGLVNTSQAQETLSASFYDGYGEITLSWNHSLSAPNVLAYSEVNVKAEKYEQGSAIATAVAETSTMEGDVGAVNTTVAAESSTLGLKGLADSEGTAQSFFLLQNTSDHNVEVSFDWSAEWLVEGAIENPETDQIKTALYLVLQKKVVRFNNVRVLAERIAHNIKDRNNLSSIFAKSIDTRLLPELSFYDSDSIVDEFTIHFGPGMTYLFVLSTELRGLATVSLGGCPPSYWGKHNDWPIDPREQFFDVFGGGPKNLSLNHAVHLRHSTEDILMSNAVAALLNAASSEVSYYTDDVNAIKALVKTTFESGDFESTNAELVYYNNLGFPQVCD